MRPHIHLDLFPLRFAGFKKRVITLGTCLYLDYSIAIKLIRNCILNIDYSIAIKLIRNKCGRYHSTSAPHTYPWRV